MDAEQRLHSHERECALRYEMIEKRLDEGSQKMRRLEMMIIGVYPFYRCFSVFSTLFKLGENNE